MWCHFGKGLEHEPPFAETRVRHRNVRLVENVIPEQNQIQIERPRRPSMWAFATTLPLQVVQSREQTRRVEARVPDRHGVQVGRLRVDHANGIGLDDG